jgi:hypothetical protein
MQEVQIGEPFDDRFRICMPCPTARSIQSRV